MPPDLRRNRLAPLLLGTLFIAGAEPAAAAYEVQSCGTSGHNNAWHQARTAPETHLEALELCSPAIVASDGAMRHGIGIRDVLWGAQLPPGGEMLGSQGLFAELVFMAPDGTRIRRASVDRDVGHAYDAWTSYGRIGGSDQASESCQPVVDDVVCRRAGVITFNALNAESLAYGVRCLTARPECRVGSTLHDAWAVVLEARVTVEDLEAPTVSGIEGIGLASGVWHRAGGEVVFSASDNTGIRERRVVEGSTVRGVAQAPSASAGGCFGGGGVAYTYTQPCAGSRGINGRRAVTASNTCSWGDGIHSIRGVAVDTGGGTSSTAPVTVKVDCSAPRVSVDAGGLEEAVAGSSLTPTLTAVDATSGVATTAVEVSVDGEAWQPVATAVEVAEGRTYRFRARATDVAGNASSWSYSSVISGVAPPPAPEEETPVITIPEAPPGDVEAEPQPQPTPPVATARADAATPAEPPLAPSAPIVRLAQPPADARLRIRSIKTTARHVQIGGTIARDFPRTIAVRATLGRRVIKRVVRPRAGAWSIKLPRMRRARVVVTAEAAGFAPARATASLRGA